jgi:hypothetical protein
MIINFLLTNAQIERETLSNKIIRELKKARYSIWLANIWFTDNDVYKLLLEKLKEGLNIEIVLSRNPLSVYENAKIQKFIDLGGEIFIINEYKNKNDNQFCIVDYSTIINNGFRTEHRLKPSQGSIFLKETQETLIEQYINEYMQLKNNYCINRY